MWVFSRTSRLPAIALGFRFYKRFNSTRIKGFCGVYRPREFAFCGQLAKVFASPLGGLSTALRAEYSRSGQPVLLQEIANQGIGCRKQLTTTHGWVRIEAFARED